MNWKIPLFKIYWNEDDVEGISKVIRSGMRWAEGPSIKEFENKIAEYLGVKYCLVFNSGTSILHALLLAHGVKKGDEVIVPSFTFIATANAPLFIGARPVFADIEARTLGLDPEDVERKITPRTKAIIPVHYGGCPCRINELRKIAKKHNVFLIEDAAESFGAGIDGKKVGTLGNSAMFSFCQNKIITTGEGGAAVTNSRKIYEALRLIRSHGRLEDNYFSSTAPFDYIALGYNFRMSSFAARLGISQLKKIGSIVDMRRENARYLTKRLKQQAPQVSVLEPPKGFFHVYQLFTIRTASRFRDGLMKYLALKGIMTKVYFYPVHKTYFYSNILKYKNRLPVTEEISRQALTLPMYPTLTRREMDRMAGEIEKFFRRKK